jgi:hypothetical protein
MQEGALTLRRATKGVNDAAETPRSSQKRKEAVAETAKRAAKSFGALSVSDQ